MSEEELLAQAGKALDRACAIAGGHEIYSSIRFATEAGASYLRPLCCRPADLMVRYLRPDFQRPFIFSGDPFADASECSPSSAKPKRGHTYAAVYNIKDLVINASVTAATTAGDELGVETLEDYPVGQRIPRFLDLARKEGIAAHGVAPPEHCIIVGRISAHEEGAQTFDCVAVIYLSRSALIAKKSTLEKLAKHFDKLFTAIDDFATTDSTSFRTASLRLVSDLVPIFQNPEIAPADKMGYLTGRIARLLSTHSVAADFGPDRKLTHPRVYFVATSFRRPDRQEEDKGHFPYFRFYPNAVAEENRNDAFVLAHRRSVSPIKYLIHRYWLQQKVWLDKGTDRLAKLQAEFTRPYADIDAHMTRPDELYVSNTRKLAVWKALVWDDAGQANKPNSFLAYVIEGIAQEKKVEEAKVQGRHLPKGVLVFESPVHSAFSVSDREILAELAARVAPLIRSLTPESAPIEYEQRLAATYASDVSSDIMRRMMHQVIRINAQSWRKVFEYIATSDCLGAGKRFSFTGVTAAQVRALIDRHETLLPPESDDVAEAEGKADEILQNRRKACLNQGEQLEEFYKDFELDVLEELFDACQSNFIWAGYTRSIANAMAERPLTEDPEFSRVSTKFFSAFDLLVASVSGELHQVIKLSQKKKLDEERGRYVRFVRYKLPIAARIPASGYAFDSDGVRGWETAKAGGDTFTTNPDRAYGALVSDLIDGRPRANPARDNRSEPSTLLDEVATILAPGDRSASSETAKRICEALQFHFTINLANWRRSELDNDALRRSQIWRDSKTGVPFELKHAISERLKTKTDELRRVSRTLIDQNPFLLELFSCMERWYLDTLTVHLRKRDGREARSEIRASFDPSKRIDYTSAASFLNSIERQLLNQGKFPSRFQVEDHMAITHGDMNGKNLSWSAPIERLVPLDFEFVDFGVEGFDQVQLIFSTLCDLYGAAWRKWPAKEFHGELSQFATATLDELTIYLATCILRTRDGVAWPAARPQLLSQNPEIESVFRAMYTLNTDASWPETREVVPFIFQCTGIAQFRFSIRDVSSALSSDCVRVMGLVLNKWREANKDEKEANMSISPGKFTEEARRIVSEGEFRDIETERRREIISQISRLCYSWACILISRDVEVD